MASTLMPQTLCTAFQQRRERFTDVNQYNDGSRQALAIPNSSRKRWSLASRLKPVDLQTLRNFYDQQFGGLFEFYFYDLYECVPQFSFDPTASAQAGLYIVVFDGVWQQSLDLGRCPAQFGLVEVT